MINAVKRAMEGGRALKLCGIVILCAHYIYMHIIYIYNIGHVKYQNFKYFFSFVKSSLPKHDH